MQQRPQSPMPWSLAVAEESPGATVPASVAMRSTRYSGPYYLLLVFVFLFFALPIVNDHPALAALRPIQLLLTLTLAWLALEKTILGKPLTVYWPETHAIVFFLFAVLLSASTSYWPRITVELSIALSKVVAIYLVIINVITDRHRLRGFFWAMTLGALVASYGTWSNYRAGIVDSEGRAIYAGNFANANELALSLLVVIPLTLSLVGRVRLPGRVLAFGTIAFALVATFLTYSRAGVLAFIAMVFVLAVRGSTPRMQAGIAAFVAIAILTFPVYSAFWEREDTFANLEEDSTFQDRVVSVQVGFLMFLDSPLIGKGYGASLFGFADYAPVEHQTTAYIHNTFAQVLAETGLVGTVMFLTFFGYSVLHVSRVGRLSRRRRDNEMLAYSGGLLSSLMAFFVAALAGPFAGWWLLYYLVALCSAVRGIVAAENAPAVQV